jgi:vacuolar-type H+-ATPase subunit D/Vma8
LTKTLEDRSDDLIEAFTRLEMAAEDYEKPADAPYERVTRRKKLAEAAIKYTKVLRQIARGTKEEE